jgi:DNA end-binding protein Ku
MHLADSKTVPFDPSKFEGHYENALTDMLRAKHAGRLIELTKAEAAPHRLVNLMDALPASLGTDTTRRPAAAAPRELRCR